MEHLVRIRGMVCPRCIQTVTNLFVVDGFPVTDVRLGQLTYAAAEPRDLTRVAERLRAEGFALLDDKQTRTITRLKELVEAWVQLGLEQPGKLAEYVSEALEQSYATLSTLFSATQGITLERYLIGRRVELAQQQLTSTNDSLSAIADRLGYSSSHHLSNQFKQETGLTPARYRELQRSLPTAAEPGDERNG